MDEIIIVNMQVSLDFYMLLRCNVLYNISSHDTNTPAVIQHSELQGTDSIRYYKLLHYQK